MASPFEKAWDFLPDWLTEPPKKRSFGDHIVDGLKRAPYVGPAVAAWDWALTDLDNAPESKSTRTPQEKILQQGMQDVARREQLAQQNKDTNDLLRDAIDQKVNSNRWLSQRARRQIMPIYRPQIRAARQNLRSINRQGRRAASDVMGYYDQAGAKVAGLSQASGRSQRRAMNKLGSGNAEARIAGNAMRGQGKATRSFFKQLQGSLAGEGAVAAADTRRSYNSLANEYRTDLGDLKAQRNAALMAAKQEMRKNINNAGEKIYEKNFLESLGAGMTRKQAAKQALAAGGAKSKAVKSQVAKSILANRGNEQLLINSKTDDNQLSFDQIMDLIASKQKFVDGIDAEQLQANPDLAKLYNKEMARILKLQQSVSP